MNSDNFIRVRGARVNNLKGVDVDIPLNKISCLVGPSGSGKTSLAFETLYSESKRRFINSFPTSMKFFADRPAPVEVDEIFPVLPVFGLPQINPVVGTRSNVADVMHITELLQSYFANYSKKLCPIHHLEFSDRKVSEHILELIPKAFQDQVWHVLIDGEEFREKLINTPLPSRSIKSKRSKKIEDFEASHSLWEVFRLKIKNTASVDKKFASYRKQNLNFYLFNSEEKKIRPLVFKFENNQACPETGCTVVPAMAEGPLAFSPYNALGACTECNGFGETLEYDPDKLYDPEKSVADGGVLLLNYKRFGDEVDYLLAEMRRKKISTKKPIKDLGAKFFDLLYEGDGDFVGFNSYFRYFERKKYKMNVRIFLRKLQKGSHCKSCDGARVGKHVQQYFVFDNEVTLKDFTNQSIQDMLNLLVNNKDRRLYQSTDANKAYKKMITILEVARNIGLGHLRLNRKAKTLSAGEYQRLLLLKYLSYDGTGSLFVFDEPSLGLSQSEMKFLVQGFKTLIEKKNTVLLVDHNQEMIKASDYIMEMGPQAGHLGGELLYQGSSKKFSIPKNELKLKPLKIKKNDAVKILQPEIYNKKYPDFSIAREQINWVTGSSGSGKTSCLINIFASYLNYLNKGEYLNLDRGKFKAIKGQLDFDDVIIVDANLNRYTSRSTVGSMTGFFPVFRKHFVKSPLGLSMGIEEGHLSYNSELGQCPACEGKGVQVVEMQFLEDIILTCEDCKGQKLKTRYATLSDGYMTVHDSYSKPLSEVIERIKLTPKFNRIYESMRRLNLDYLSLDRQINSLSGGEKQRIYLLNKLQKNIENSILFFENISFGLSMVELEKMCEFLQDLSVKGNTIIIIDQNGIFQKIANKTIKF